MASGRLVRLPLLRRSRRLCIVSDHVSAHRAAGERGNAIVAALYLFPITAGGAVANVGATAGILLALGVSKDIAINFSRASGLLLVTSASAAALSGVAVSVGTRALTLRRPTLPQA